MAEKTVTKEEVWAGFAELRAINVEAAKRFAELREEQAERDRRSEERDAELKEEQAERDRAADERSRKLDEQLAKLKVQVAEMSRKVSETTKQMGGMANSDGAFAEEYFFNALGDSRQFGGQHYDIVDGNVKRTINGKRDQFDIIMYNGSSVALIEVKYKADLDDIDVLATRKVQNFRAFFPQYKDHKIYLGLASMSFDEKVITKAHALGVGTIKQIGDTIESDTACLRPY